ncbi:uncharacterized protein J4E79_010538 [Alternaria viburni]|uniref:uncharacterized protein n=1 Tax=Alternaria viburni TaxID=566460 RepID=UPI0020C311CF|nr:uncharacterized protein J4E79_010538 [Alternaria viburni]KAI4646476.1 hypothetical protein J4E79_010538 [Alternaria viburni]
MSLYILEETPADGPDEVMRCSFFAFDRGICAADADENRLRFSHIIICEPVDDPLALCRECVEVMHCYDEVNEFIEKEGSKQQKKLFTQEGKVTYKCMMMERPTEKDLAELWQERFKRSGPEGCQRVLGEHQICANDYEFYLKKPSGKEVIDKYFGEDRIRRSVPAGP